MGRRSYKERWIEAMSRITWSLVEYGLTKKEATIVCAQYHKNPPKKPSLQTIISLEREAEGLPLRRLK